MLNSKPKFNAKIVYSVDDINVKEWNSIYTNNVFLDLNYLESIEKTVSEITRFYYVMYFDNENKPIGKSVFQKLQYDTSTFNFDSIPCRGKNTLLRLFLKPKIAILIAGNIFATGDNIFSFNDDIRLSNIFYNINLIVNQIFKKDESLNYTIFKEFHPDDDFIETTLKKHHYLKFNIDVNMILKLKSNWQNFIDLSNDYRTKYRSRFKNVLNKSKNLTVRNLTVVDIKNNASDFQNLYNQVLKNSNFNLGIFNIETFINLKEKLAERYTVFGYFVDEKLIGFRSAFRKNGNLETSFVGIDYHVNLKYDLYQRMLIDFIDYGFENNLKSIGFGRTAETMKSAFGAMPINMNLFIRPKKTSGKFLLRLIIQNINPTKFSLRQPFKKVFYKEKNEIQEELKIETTSFFKKLKYCPIRIVKQHIIN